MQSVVALAESKPIATGIAGALAGVGSSIVYWLDLLGKFAGTLGVIFGCVSAFFAMLLVIRKYLKNKE